MRKIAGSIFVSVVVCAAVFSIFSVAHAEPPMINDGGGGGEDTNGGDNPPAFSNFNPPTGATVYIAYSYDVEATDPEGGQLTYSLVGTPVGTTLIISWPQGMTIDPTTGVISWTPAQSDTAGNPHPVTVRVSDGTNNIDQTFSITVSPNGSAQFSNFSPPGTAEESVQYSYDTDATDPEGEAIVFSLVTAPSGMTIDPATGTIQWTPNSSHVPGPHAVTVRVSDGHTDIDQTFSVSVSGSNSGNTGNNGGGGGGGGGGGITYYYSITINGNALVTAAPTVTLSIVATGATEMLISNNSDFSDAAWKPIAYSVTWALSTGDGAKTVYGKFRNAGTILGTAEATIALQSGGSSRNASNGGPGGSNANTGATGGTEGTGTGGISVAQASESDKNLASDSQVSGNLETARPNQSELPPQGLLAQIFSTFGGGSFFLIGILLILIGLYLFFSRRDEEESRPREAGMPRN